MKMVTDWIQAVCSILIVFISAFGVIRTLPKISKDINRSANERMDKLEQQLREHIRGYSDEAVLNIWKRLIDLYTNNKEMREYSNLEENGDKNE